MTRTIKALSQDGLTLDQLFGNGDGYTFDDVQVLPPFSNVSAQEVNTTMSLAPGITLKLPLVSSPMDSVTEWLTAVYMALIGGLGIIHFNLTPEEVADQVKRVKRFQMGFIYDPLCRKPGDPCSEVSRVKETHGFSTLLITADGTKNSALLGMVMKGNVALEEDLSKPLQQVMIPINELTIRLATEVASLVDAREVLRKNPSASKLPLLKTDGSVVALVTRKGVAKSTEYPNATLGDNDQLIVGAAVSTHNEDQRRVRLLLDAGVDVITIDAAQGGTAFALEMIDYIHGQNAEVAIIAGNVVTAAQARPLIEAGINGIRVGMGSGSICTTQEVLGMGSSQLAAVYYISRLLREMGAQCRLISDGGIKKPADMMKAYVCGADLVMVGGFIAGCTETPAKLRKDPDGQRMWKLYRGMGSPEAIAAGGEKRYGQVGDLRGAAVVPQGVERWVSFTGPLEAHLQQLPAIFLKGFENLGCTDIDSLHTRVREGNIQFQVRSSAAREEGKPAQ